MNDPLRRTLLALVCIATIVLFFACRHATGAGLRLPDTSLSIDLPPDWELANARQPGLSTTAIHYKGAPAFEITVKESATVNPLKVATSLPFECDVMFGVLASVNNGKVTAILPRPTYMPQDYYANVLAPRPVEQRPMVVACLYLGSSTVSVGIRPAPKDEEGVIVAPILQAIAASARKNSTMVYGPGDVPLQELGVKSTMASGIWSSGKMPFGSVGEVDLLVRTGGAAELKIMPMVFGGTCATQRLPGTRRDNPPYVSAKWYPAASEEFRQNDSINKLSLMVCRQITQKQGLLVMMMYGAPSISEVDAPLIARSLDDLADAVIRNQK
jgi:hypothetical protein